MASLTFFGGVGEIGGNKILLEEKSTRVLIDFGVSYGRRALFYDEYLSPRSASGLGDFLRMGLIPDMPGIYRNDLLATVGREPETPAVDAVLLSHAHMDHSSYISFLHEKIPVYCGETCKLILQAIQEAGDRDIEQEILAYKPRPIARNGPEISREIHTFRTGQQLSIGDIKVEPIHVDHSIPGDYAFLIHTSDGTIVYTADLRMHGNRPDMTEDFIKAASESEPIALITEGTRITEASPSGGEPGVRKASNILVQSTDGLVLADFSFKDVDRFHTFQEIAKENERKLAIPLKDAYFLKHLTHDPKLGLPPPNDLDILIILPKRGSGQYKESDYGVSDRQFLSQSNVAKPEQVNKQQSSVLACLGYFDMGIISDISPEPGGIYIHSSSEAFNEEMVLDQNRLRHWTDFFGMKYYQSHASGHANGHEITEMIRRIQPKMVFPIHTESPESFKGIIDHTKMVESGKPYALSS